MKSTFAIVAMLISTAALADDKQPEPPRTISVQLSPEQGQVLVNIANAEIERACLRGNCWQAAKVLGPIVEAIVEAAKERKP